METTTTNSHYYEDDICITAMGCVLPQSRNVGECWQNLLKGESLVSKVPKNYIDPELFYDPTFNAPEKSHSCMAAIIDDSIKDEIRNKLDLDSYYTDTQVLLMGAFDEMYRSLDSEALKNSNKVGFSIGTMLPDKDLYLSFLSEEGKIREIIDNSDISDELKQKAHDELYEFFYSKQKALKRHVDARYPTSTIHKIKERYNLTGEEAIIDAACAGGIAAFDVACKMLKNDDLDIVFTGAIESNIPTILFIMFSSMKALAPEISLPLDKDSQGTSFGEGAVMFAIQKVKTALANNHQILGIIKGTGATSNGQAASLFSLSKDSIINAFENTYKNSADKELDFLECHGSGTRLGDQTELESIHTYWNSSNLTIGTSKAVFGHGKGVAGATGLLKCLLSIKNKTIPPSPYFNQFKTPYDNLSVNKAPLSLNKETPLKMGISALGFGGANYHLLLEEFNPEHKIISQESDHNRQQEGIAVISQVQMTTEQLKGYDHSAKFKIPPTVVERTDKAQLNALITTNLALEKIGPQLQILDKSKIGVISVAPIGLDFTEHIDKRIKFLELSQHVANEENGLAEKINALRSVYPIINEDCGPGLLANVIAGRVCEKFDFTGKSYHIDADDKGLPFALKMAALEIQAGLNIVVLVYSAREEKYIELPQWNATIPRRSEKSFSTFIISSPDFAKNNALPIDSIISNIEYQPRTS